MLSGAGRFLARRAAAALRNLPEFVPPLEFPCRIERLPEGCSTIEIFLVRNGMVAVVNEPDPAVSSPLTVADLLHTSPSPRT